MTGPDPVEVGRPFGSKGPPDFPCKSAGVVEYSELDLDEEPGPESR